RHRQAEDVADRSGTSNRDDATAAFHEFLEGRHGLVVGDTAETSAVFGWNRFRIDCGAVTAASAAPGSPAANSAIGEDADVKFRFKIARIERGGVHHFERKLVPLEKPAGPARGHRAAVIIVEADANGFQLE